MKAKQTKLTEQQELQAVHLFNQENDVTYVFIAQTIGVPYGLVNKFMTKWKKRMGILKSRPERRKSRRNTPTTHKVYVETPAPKKAKNEDELKFLRGFYIKHLDSELSN